jgi:sterol desaturase/sphingolipid hydroxylase (fatty acid hydroxylase superfamily)
MPPIAWMPTTEPAWLLRSWLLHAAMDGTRYLVAAGLVWAITQVWWRQRLAHRLIGQWPTRADMRREVQYAIASMVVFAALGVALNAGVLSGHARIYRDPAQHGWLWFWASLPVMIVWHDAYFYWTHRLLHTRWLFRRVHGVHHRSRHPSPWAAYAFHPIEALISGLVVPLALCAVPLHAAVLVAFGLHQVVRSAYGHAAVETLPRGFVRHRFWRHFTTTTHHHLHHESPQGHYGLWLTWWDRLAGTERADYLARFDAATTPRPLPTDATHLTR